MDRVSLFQWEVTAACNLRCRHCYIDLVNARPADVVEARDETVISFLADTGVDTVEFIGGEPLLRKELIKATVAALGDSVGYEVVSNGLLLDTPFCAFLAQHAIRLGISLDGASEDVHEVFRPSGSFSRLTRKLDLLHQNRIHWNAISVLSKANVNHLSALAAFAHQKHAEKLHLLLLATRPKNEARLSYYVLSQRELEGIDARVSDISDQVGIAISASFYADISDGLIAGSDSDGSTKYGCDAGIFRFALLCNGSLSPCISLRDRLAFPVERSIGETVAAVRAACRDARHRYKKVSCLECGYVESCEPKLCNFAGKAPCQPGL